jgi:hypothetical protein
MIRLRTMIISGLVRGYPVAWRREYGAELYDTLAARPLNPAIISDVLWTGLRERIRVAEPATLLGLAMMSVVLSEFVSGWAAILEPSRMTLPTVVVKPFQSNFYLLLIFALGCWVNMRPGARLKQSGRSAVRVSFFAGLPVFVAGVLMMLGLLNAPAVGPQHHVRTSLEVICAPLFALPTAWLWGIIGGFLADRCRAFVALKS